MKHLLSFSNGIVVSLYSNNFLDEAKERCRSMCLDGKVLDENYRVIHTILWIKL